MLTMVKGEFTVWLEVELARRRWTRADLAREANISQATLSHIYSGRRKLGYEVASAIAKALDVPIGVVLVEAGMEEPDAEYDPIFEELLSLYRRMTEDQKDEFMAIARLKAQNARRSSILKKHGTGENIEKVEGRGT